MPGEIYIWIMPTGRYQEEGGSGVPSGSFGALEANEIEGRLLAILGPPPRRRLFH